SHEPGFREGLEVVGRDAEVVAVRDRDEGDPVLARPAHGFPHREPARLEREAAARIDEARGPGIACDRRNRRALRAAVLHVAAVLRNARGAVGGKPFHLRGGERARGLPRHGAARAGTHERRGHHALELVDRDGDGAHAAMSDSPGCTRVNRTGCQATEKRPSWSVTREKAERARSPVAGKSSRKCAPRESSRASAATRIAELTVTRFER